jgi:hypothetical protein
VHGGDTRGRPCGLVAFGRMRGPEVRRYRPVLGLLLCVPIVVAQGGEELAAAERMPPQSAAQARLWANG